MAFRIVVALPSSHGQPHTKDLGLCCLVEMAKAQRVRRTR